MNKGDIITLSGPAEWPHFKGQKAVVVRPIAGTDTAIVKTIADGDMIPLLRTAKEMTISKIAKPKMEKQKIEMEKQTKMQNDVQANRQTNRQTQKNTNVGPFERFAPTYGRVSNQTPRASLVSKGILAFNAASCSIYRILDYAYYVAFYDKNTRRIGILFTDDKNEPGARTFGHRKNYAHLSVRLFFDFYGIDMAKRYFDISEGDGGMLVLEEVES